MATNSAYTTRHSKKHSANWDSEHGTLYWKKRATENGAIL